MVLLFSSLLVAHLATSALCFPDNSVGKESTCNAGDPSLIPRSGRSAGEGIGCPLQCSWASLVARLERIHLQCGRPGFDPWVGKSPWRRERLPTPVFWRGEFHGLYSPWGCKASDTTERLHCHFSLSCTGEGNGNPLQCSCLENSGTVEPGGLPSMGSYRVGHD